VLERLVFILTVVATPFVIWANCNAGLRSEFLNYCTQQLDGTGSYKAEFNPAYEYLCTVRPFNTGKKCVVGLVGLHRKLTNYDGPNCTGNVTSTTGWQYNGLVGADSLCTCPP
jgi:hypothetical protein